MEPLSALIPQEIFIPSRAGPTAQELAISLLLVLRTISPLVPMSINKILFKVSFCLYNSLTYIPETISEPTKADI